MFINIVWKKFITIAVFCAILIGCIILTFVFLKASPAALVDNTAESQPVLEVGSILIIDPGHGGEDGGATSDLSAMMESEINLDIALNLEALCGLFGIETEMTRQSESIDYPEGTGSTRERKVSDQKARVELINSMESPVLISIHQNKFPGGKPKGAQVFYALGDGSEELGAIAHNKLIAALSPENRRVPAPVPDSIYLMKNISCPAILVECGFISNPEEAALLNSSEYRMKIAAVLLCSYMEWTSAV